MQPIGMRVLIERDQDDEDGFDLHIPPWIAEQLGDLLLMEFMGDRLIVSAAKHGDLF
jgi:hypothetical protein